MTSRTHPSLWIVAGPNGVGKTTYAMQHISHVSGTIEFINQDEIARGLYPLAPTVPKALYEAGKVSAQRKSTYLRRRESFSLETTLSGRTYLRLIREAKARGYKVNLLFFFIAHVDECLKRIARRVLCGGHDVPEEDVRRRFQRSMNSFAEYAACCDHWTLFDNHSPQPIIVAEFSNGIVSIFDELRLTHAPTTLENGVRMIHDMFS